jgi:hypothetical protein
MKQEKRRTEIYIETRSVTVIRANGKSFAAHCQRCETTVVAFTPEQVAVFINLSLAEVCRRIETAELHLTQTNRGLALICGNSLRESQKTTQT